MTYSRPVQRTTDDVAARAVPVRTSDLDGISPARLKAALQAGALTRLRRGIVVPTEAWMNADPHDRHRMAVRAALLAYPGSWASHTSALLLHGVSTLAPSDVRGLPVVHISRAGRFYREPGLIVHDQRVDDEDLCVLGGLTSSTLIRASIEVAARRPLGQALAVIDASMRQMLVNEGPTSLREAARARTTRRRLYGLWDARIAPYSRHRWVTTVRTAARLGNPAAESYLESLSRAAMWQAGFPEPEIGFPLVGDDGKGYWVDFWWRSARVIGEADGLTKYATSGHLIAEKLRSEALGIHGAMCRWGMAQVVPDPLPMLGRLRSAFPYPPIPAEWRFWGAEAA